MNPYSGNSSSMEAVGLPSDASSKKVRKPYTITKSRESWTEEEHDKFLEALQLFDRDWKKIEDFVGSKTVIQIRSHAQKYFMKVQKNGTITHVPPPRPKRKATHPYPQKAAKNTLVPLEVPVVHPSAINTPPGYSPWDDSSILTNTVRSGSQLTQDSSMVQGIEDIELRTESTTNNALTFGGTSTLLSDPDQQKQGNPGSPCHGIPDFAEVYNFIGSVFDPETKGHVQRLKEMDPINVETVLLLMRNLSINLSSPNFEQLRKLLSSCDDSNKRNHDPDE